MIDNPLINRVASAPVMHSQMSLQLQEQRFRKLSLMQMVLYGRSYN